MVSIIVKKKYEGCEFVNLVMQFLITNQLYIRISSFEEVLPIQT